MDPSVPAPTGGGLAGISESAVGRVRLRATGNLFFGIPLDGEAGSQLTPLLAELRLHSARPSVPRDAGIHITVAFLGRPDPALLPGLEQQAAAVCRAFPPLPLDLSGLGRFPLRSGSGGAEVLYLAVSRGQEQLAALATRLWAGLQTLGLEAPGRPLVPHCTLARGRVGRPPPTSLSGLPQSPITHLADRLCLFVSHPEPEGPPTYPVVASWELTG